MRVTGICQKRAKLDLVHSMITLKQACLFRGKHEGIKITVHSSIEIVKYIYKVKECPTFLQGDFASDLSDIKKIIDHSDISAIMTTLFGPIAGNCRNEHHS